MQLPNVFARAPIPIFRMWLSVLILQTFVNLRQHVLLTLPLKYVPQDQSTIEQL